MRISENDISFDRYDIPFIQKNGLLNAVQTATDFYTSHPQHFPFLYDVEQLSGLFLMNRKRLFNLMKGVDEHYQPIEVIKKNGGTRLLHEPDRKLKQLQHTILREILTSFTPSQYSKAYVRRRTLMDNASPHVGKRYLLKLDIADFFGSIRFGQVYSAVFNTKHFPRQIGMMLTSFCCYKGALPQGAPTSPALSNLVMRDFDDHIGDWCAQRGIAFTQYSDDMTFSSNQPLYHVYQKAKAMLEESGFRLNEEKTRFVTSSSRQSVTGLTVNEKVAVSREYKRRVRQEAYYALKYGGLDEKERHRLIGKINYILQIEPDNTQFRSVQEQMWQLGHV